MKKALIVIFICLTFISCSSEKKPIPVIDLKNNHKTKVIKLSDMISRIQVARLETADNILLGQYTQYLVSDRFIVTIDFDRILQFSNKGVFIKTLAKAGKGPDEFSRVDAFALDGEMRFFTLITGAIINI